MFCKTRDVIQLRVVIADGESGASVDTMAAEVTTTTSTIPGDVTTTTVGAATAVHTTNSDGGSGAAIVGVGLIGAGVAAAVVWWAKAARA